MQDFERYCRRVRVAVLAMALGVAGFGLSGLASAEEITGDDENNTLTGTDGEDEIDGKGGDDTIDAMDGADEILGGTGNDTIDGGDGADEIDGGHGEDTIDGGADADTINGGMHNDTIDGGGGDDIIDSGGGGDKVNGGDHNDRITLGPSWPTESLGYPAKNTSYPAEGEAEFRLADKGILSQAFGDAGNDHLKAEPGQPWNGWGYSFHYLDGGEGVDVVEGSGGQDLLVLRGNDGDTVITGAYEDVVAIVGNSVEGYIFYDALKYLPNGDVEKDEAGKPIDYNNGTDMICFVRDVNPQQLTMISVFASGSWKQFMEFDTGLPTQEAVNLNLNEHPMLKNFEAFRTGDGNDTIVGRDYGSPEGPNVPASYAIRLKGSFKPASAWGNDPDSIAWLNLHELFFTGAGNDTITTGRGNDLVDSGAGNDTIHLGPDNCFVITGSGNDTIHMNASVMNGSDSDSPDGGKLRIADFEFGDRIIITGVQASQITLGQTTMPQNKGHALAGKVFTIIKVDGDEEFVLMDRRAGDIEIKSVGGKATITEKRKVQVSTDPPPVNVHGPGKGDGGKKPVGTPDKKIGR